LTWADLGAPYGRTRRAPWPGRRASASIRRVICRFTALFAAARI